MVGIQQTSVLGLSKNCSLLRARVCYSPCIHRVVTEMSTVHRLFLQLCPPYAFVFSYFEHESVVKTFIGELRFAEFVETLSPLWTLNVHYRVQKSQLFWTVECILDIVIPRVVSLFRDCSSSVSFETVPVVASRRL